MSRNQLETRAEQLQEQLAVLQQQEADYKAQNLMEFFEPWAYQKQIIDYIWDGKMIVSLQGANGIGKTKLGSCIVGSAALGIQPWDGAETRWGKNPVKIKVICSNWEDHAKKVLVPTLKEHFPKGTYTTTKNNTGVESDFQFDNGSELLIQTGKQSVEDHESWEGDIIWADEPFPQEKFPANLRALRRPRGHVLCGKGLFLFTLTMTREFWIWDDIINNPDRAYASIHHISQDDAPHLDDEHKRVFAASLTARQRIARVQGGSVNLIDMIWPGFRKDIVGDKISHIVDDFTVPTDWPVVPIVDYHPSNPQAISYYAFDPYDREFAIDEEWCEDRRSPEELSDRIIRKKKENTWRIKDVFIDPIAKGDTAYIKNRGVEIDDSFTVMKERLWKERIELHVATKDQVSGIINVEKMLDPPSGLPSLFFFRSLINKTENEGHIWEIQRWTYEENNKPKENFHFMENLYRSTLTGIKYTVPHRKGEELTSETEFNVFT